MAMLRVPGAKGTGRMAQVPGYFNLRHKSLVRGNVLVVASLVAAIVLSDFPNLRATLWLTVPLLLSAMGTADTVRCMRQRWGFYHAGVILCIYMDLMVLSLVLFLLLYPYWRFLASSV